MFVNITPEKIADSVEWNWTRAHEMEKVNPQVAIWSWIVISNMLAEIALMMANATHPQSSRLWADQSSDVLMLAKIASDHHARIRLVEAVQKERTQ